MPLDTTTPEKPRTQFNDLADKANMLDAVKTVRIGAEITKSNQQVGGWLLFLCVSFTILNPLVTGFNLFSGFEASKQFFEMYPGIKTVLVADAILSAFLACFSIYAGLGLWRIREGAVQTAKIYLLAFLGYSMLATVLPFMAGLPSEADGVLLIAGLGALAKAFVYVSIWYSYLMRSTRVRETYGE